MFFKEPNNSPLIAERMNTMEIMLARELTPKDFLALIALVMNFRLQWKKRGQRNWIQVDNLPALLTQRVD